MRRITILVALCWGAAAAAPAAVRDAGWHAETVGRISKLSQYWFDGMLAVGANARGRRVLVWAERDGVHVAVARPGRRFGRGRLVHRERYDAARPRVAMNARGEAVIAWDYLDGTYLAGIEDRDGDCCYGSRVALLHRDGRLGRVSTLGGPGVWTSTEGLAIDGRGRYGVVWEEADYADDLLHDPHGKARFGLFGRFSRGHHGLGPARKIHHFGPGLALAFVRGRPRVLIHASKRRLVERTAHSNGRFGAPRTVAGGVPYDAYIAAAANARGDEVVAWEVGGGDHRLHVGSRRAGGRLRQRDVGHLESYGTPTVAISPSGAAVAAWESSGDAYASTSNGAGRRFSPALTLFKSKPEAYVYSLETAIDSRARAVVAWNVTGLRRFENLHAAVVRDGERERHVRFRGHGDAQLAYLGAAAFDEHGRATVVWERSDEVRAAQVSVER